MANPAWPATLPSIAVDGSAQYAPLADNVISTQMETGAPKRRRRFTAMPETFACTLKVTGAQTLLLTSFVAVTLQDVQPFDWVDFRTGAVATYVFRKRPSFAHIADSKGLWTTTLDLLKVA